MGSVATAALLAASLAAGGMRAPAPAATGPEEHIALAEEALVDGAPAVAAEHFTAAYEGLASDQHTSDLGSLLVGEAVKARLAAWRGTTEIEHLVSARDLLRTHVERVEAGGGDAAVFFEEVVLIDGMITRAHDVESAEPPPPARVDPRSLEDEPPPPPTVDPSHRKRFVAGMSLVGVGAVMFTVGTTLTAVYLVSARDFSDRLKRDNDIIASDCVDTAAQMTVECRQKENNVVQWRSDGRKANNLALAMGTVGGVGLVMLAVGLAVGLTTSPDARRIIVSSAPGGLQVRF